MRNLFEMYITIDCLQTVPVLRKRDISSTASNPLICNLRSSHFTCAWAPVQRRWQNTAYALPMGRQAPHLPHFIVLHATWTTAKALLASSL